MSPKVLPSHSPPAPKLSYAVPSSFHPLTDRVKEPLELLRGLADKYKESSGLVEPLNLSIKAQSQEANKSTASSFSPPTASYPRFLNDAPRPFSLHPPQVKNERSETQEDEAAPYSPPIEDKDVYITSVSNSPVSACGPALRADGGPAVPAQKASSPKTDFTCPSEERSRGGDVRRLNLSQILPSLPRDNGGKMEIEIPLSVLHEWLRLCEASGPMHGPKQPTPQEEPSAHRTFTDALPTNMPPHTSSKRQSPAAEDLSLRQRNPPSPTTTIQTGGHHHNVGQNHFTGYKASPPGDALKNASSPDVFPVDQLSLMKSYNSKPPHYWDVYKQRTDSIALSQGEDFTVTKAYSEETPKGGRGRMAGQDVLMLNSSSSSVLHLTPEELMKLKKIIASSM